MLARLPRILLFGMLMTSLMAHPVLAAEDSVIVPEVDPHLDDGYVDVYYHKCPVVGSDPCSHHHVTRITVPCVDPSVSQEADGVHVSNCDYDYVVPAPCVDPSVTPDLAGPNYGATVSNCGTSTPVQSPCVDPDAGQDTYWSWYGQVTEVYVENCSTRREVQVCQEPLGFDNDETELRNTSNCRPTSCVAHGVSRNFDNSVTVQVGNCTNPTDVTTPCAQPSATPDLAGPNYGATVSNCGTSTPVQSPCVDPEAGQDTYWSWYGQVTEVYVENCNTRREAQVCQEPLGFDNDETELRNTSNCRPTSCVAHGVSTNPDGSLTVEVGNCNNPADVTTPCADTDGTTVGPSGDDVRATVVVCGQTHVDRTVTPPAPVAPCGSAGSGGGNTVYVRIYPTCDYSDPANPQPTSAPIEREFHVGP